MVNLFSHIILGIYFAVLFCTVMCDEINFLSEHLSETKNVNINEMIRNCTDGVRKE